MRKAGDCGQREDASSGMKTVMGGEDRVQCGTTEKAVRRSVGCGVETISFPGIVVIELSTTPRNHVRYLHNEAIAHGDLKCVG